ncbi:TnsD family Tn7-like transposition protein [Undibacterium arcticum]|uniref:TnsD family Tn7-like transposition protein n=1 Tax=Undibacterium arcticum TaxID=1762892 RepID=UPI00360D1E8E
MATTDSLQQIAQVHSVSLPSLYRILRREPAVAAARNDRHRDMRRQRFIDELRAMPPRRAQDYMWLYRNDRAWLDQQTALQLERPSKSAQWRVDWNKRDIKLTQAVRHWAMVFYATIPPIRVSKTLVARSTGMQTTIEKYASRLPLTVAAIAQATESVEDFQCRRLERAGEELMAFGQPLLPWEILRIAGVKPPLLPAVVRTLAKITGS